MAKEPAERKIGEGHASAMLRQGIRELRGSLYTGSNVAQQSEYGLYGTMTPGEIAEARRGDPSPTLDEEKVESPLQQSLRQAEARSPERDTREIVMER